MRENDINRLQAVKRDYLQGLSLEEIAVKYGYRYKTSVSYALQRTGTPTKTKHWDEKEIETLREIYPTRNWELILSSIPNHPKSSIISMASVLKIRMESYRWSKEEIAILTDNYANCSGKKMCELLPNRSYLSITSKARKLKLAVKNYWNNEDNELLKELFPVLKTKDLVKVLGRTKDAIQVQANTLGLYKDAVKYKKRKDDIVEKELIAKLIEFAEELGRTPMEQDLNERPDMPGVLSYHRRFGSYVKACILAGLEPNARMYGNNKIQTYQASNGDICYSAAELKITEFLISNNISFSKEVLYRDIMQDARCNGRKCDWLINDTVIVEYFGLHTKDFYKLKMDVKFQLCADNNIRLLPVYVYDLGNLKDIFKEFI